MRQIFSILILFLPLSLIGQEFSFSMYFEDAVGNKDTLVLGYDPAARDDINIQFGEENISHEPFIKDLDVRTGLLENYYMSSDSFLTKKHISPKTCFTAEYPIPGYIYIYCKHFPLRISWDLVFIDDCNKYSFITDWYPGGWFDAVSGGQQGPFLMKDSASITFNHLNVYDDIENLFQYNDVNLNVLYYSLWYSSNLSSIKKILPGKKIVYPNPGRDLLYVQTGNGEFESVQILDLSGQIYTESNTNPIQISTLPEGIYLLKIKLKNNPNVFVQKLSKIN